MRHSLALAASLVCCGLSAAAAPPLVELRTADGAFQGRVYAQDDATGWLLDRDGSLVAVPLRKVVDFGVVEPSFRPYSAVDLRDRLRAQVGGGAEVVASPHFVVAGRPDAARAVADALEAVHNGYRWFCSTRGLRLSDPECPLIAVVLPDRASFDRACRADGMSPDPQLRGYYSALSNRFVLYEPDRARDAAPGDRLAAIRDTLTHEAIHQLAFNTGLHVRLGADPQWVKEGLATALEPDAVREPRRSSDSPLDRTNPERLRWYLDLAGRPNRLRLADLVASDAPFQTVALDAYATAWALSFYLLETRPADYGRYLRTLAARPPLTESNPAERLADFQAAFGSDLPMLEAEMTRYLRRIAERQ